MGHPDKRYKREREKKTRKVKREKRGTNEQLHKKK